MLEAFALISVIFCVVSSSFNSSASLDSFDNEIADVLAMLS
ncbi:hypothetical protein GPSY_0616 [Paraglaciecola psychrophila 170]|jgi:hypothetical protein|nr:hypothetical protein GPSY_0616 [Paraglaciecola psychrophila 170]